jgi:hypothetical protein
VKKLLVRLPSGRLGSLEIDDKLSLRCYLVCYVDSYRGKGGIAPTTVELGKEALPTKARGGRIRKGEQRHDDYYHAFIARARAQP